MNGIHVIHAVVQINRSVQKHIADARLHNPPVSRVIALFNQGGLSRLGLPMLHESKQQIAQAKNGGRPGKPTVTAFDPENE